MDGRGRALGRTVVRALAASVVAGAAIGGLVACSGDGERETHSGPPTYWQDIAPVLDTHCRGCHTAGGFAAISFDDPADVVAVAPILKEKVVSREMPPWLAAPGCRGYVGDFSLDDAQIALLAAWVDAGAPLGDAAHPAPPGPVISVGLPRVDVQVGMGAAYTQRITPDELRCFVLDWPVERQVYITGYNALPGRPEAVHHMSLFVAYPDKIAELEQLDAKDGRPGFPCLSGAPSEYLLGSWVPGSFGYELPAGTGYRVVPGSKVVLQMHYNDEALGVPVPDRSSLQFETADSVDRPAKLVHWHDLAWERSLFIPAGSDDVSVHSSGSLGFPAAKVVSWANIHMHYLGSSGELDILRADGSRECLLRIDRWNFHWQAAFLLTEPTVLEPGDKLDLMCKWDNTAAHQRLVSNHLAVPQDVTWGRISSEEMCTSSVYTTDP